MKPPSLEEFLDHGFERIPIYHEQVKDPTRYKKFLVSKYYYWADADWVDGNGKPIKAWKQKLNNAIRFMMVNEITVVDPVDLTELVLKKWN